MSPSGFEFAYQGTPPWDIGRAQPAIVRLEEAGAITGRVLDVGCGTGENALYLAARGHQITGVDAAPTAIARARQKAAERGLPATFHVGDVLALGEMRELAGGDRAGGIGDSAAQSGSFGDPAAQSGSSGDPAAQSGGAVAGVARAAGLDTAVDSGCFHVFSNEERAVFTPSLASVVRPGGRYFLLCFSDEETSDGGPRRVSQAEIRATFGPDIGWEVEQIEPTRFEALAPRYSAKAWLARIRRLG